MKSHFYTLLVFINLVPAVAFNQEKITTNENYSTSRNGWYIELAGSSLIGLTANYERYLSKKTGGFSIHAGIGEHFFSVSGNQADLAQSRQVCPTIFLFQKIARILLKLAETTRIFSEAEPEKAFSAPS